MMKLLECCPASSQAENLLDHIRIRERICLGLVPSLL